MTTATRTRANADVLGELQAREQRWQEATAEADRLGSEHGQKARQLEALQDQRRRLIHSQPEVVDHTGAPVGKKNPVAAIDKQIADLGDLLDLHGQVFHARRLEESAKQATHDYTAAHLDVILAALEPDARHVRDEVVRAMGALAEASSAYLAMAGRVNGLKGTIRERQHERVLAYDTGSDLVKLSRDYEPPPLPTEIR